MCTCIYIYVYECVCDYTYMTFEVLEGDMWKIQLFTVYTHL